MNALSIVVLVIGCVLPFVGCAVGVWLSMSRQPFIRFLAVCTPIGSFAIGGILFERSAVIAGHPEWNLDIPSQPMGIMAAWGVFWSTIAGVVAFCFTLFVMWVVDQEARMQTSSRT